MNDWRVLAGIGLIVVMIVVLVVVLTNTGGVQAPTLSSADGTTTALAQSINDAYATQTQLAAVPTIDATVAALETQLAEQATEAAEAAEATAVAMAQSVADAFATQTMAAFVPTTDPAIGTLQAQGTQLAEQLTQAAQAPRQASTESPGQQPSIVVVTATPAARAASQTTSPRPTASRSGTNSTGTTDYPLQGRTFQAYVGSTTNNAYAAVWTADGRLYQPSLPPSSQRTAHNVALEIAEGRYAFNGVDCVMYLDAERNGQGSQNPVVAFYQNGVEFDVDTADDDPAWALVECRSGANTGFEIMYLGT